MKWLLYGRQPDSPRYRVLDHDPALREDEKREISTLFSSEDPGFQILQIAGPFAVFIPFVNDQWIFGEGDVAEKDDRYSFILRAVLLEPMELEVLHFNPFPIADKLLPQWNHQDPALWKPPDSIEEFGRRYPRLLAERVLELQRGKQTAFLETVGRIAETVLLGLGETPVVYPFDIRVHTSVWSLVYFLLPKTIRRRSSLRSLSPFVLRETLIQGDLPERVKMTGSRLAVSQDQQPRSELGAFLMALAETPLTEIEDQIQVFQTARRDFYRVRQDTSHLDTGEALLGAYLRSLRGVLRDKARPPRKALRAWIETPAHIHLFPQKTKRLMALRAEIITERDPSNNLIDKEILTSLVRDYDSIPEEKTATKGRTKAVMDETIKTLKAMERKDLLPVLVDSKTLSEACLTRMDDLMLVNVLWQTRTAELFWQTLIEKLSRLKRWRSTLDILLGHPFFYLGKTEYFAQVWRTLPRDKKPFFLSRLIEKSPIGRAAGLRGLLSAVEDKRREILILCIEISRRKIVARTANDDRYVRILRVCQDVDPGLLADRAGDWINQRDAEWLMEAVARDPDLLGHLLPVWTNTASHELATLRLLYLINTNRDATSDSAGAYEVVRVAPSENALFEILLNQVP